MKKNHYLKHIIILLICVVLFGISANAASASKVSYKNNRYKSGSHYYQNATIKGKTKSNKTVWTYKTSTCSATELNSSACISNSKYVFIIDDNKYIKLKKTTGKVLVKKTLPQRIWGAVLYVDSSNNLYCMGYYSNTLYKIKPSGKVAWSYKFPNKYYWPKKIKTTKSTVKVTFDCFYPSKTISIKNR